MSPHPGNFAAERILVLGFGVTGRAVCRFAIDRGLKVFLSERRELSDAEKLWLDEHGVAYEGGGHTERSLEGVDAIILSPSVPPTLPLLASARRRGIPVYSEIDLASLAGPSCPIVGVTGTNGKSSTVALIGALLGHFGWNAPVVGNIGAPFIGAVGGTRGGDAFVVEVSSYQLEQSTVFRPNIGALLNLAPDHLARHRTMQAYAEAKGRLFRLQTADDVAILPRSLGREFAQGAARRIYYDDPPLALPDDAGRLGLHQQANLRAALCVCDVLLPEIDRRRIPFDLIEAALRLPHRMEEVGAIGGVQVIDDSKATNPASTIAALAAFDRPVVLLLGGRFKGAGYEALRAAIVDSEIRRIVLFGEAADRLADVFEGCPFDRAKDVEDAVRAGLDAACPGDTLLFSPACSSFDEFDNFEERGKAFQRRIQAQDGFAAD